MARLDRGFWAEGNSRIRAMIESVVVIISTRLDDQGRQDMVNNQY